MFVTPEDQAISLLNNNKLPYHKREFAIHYIAEHPTPAGIKRLVAALRDFDFPIRWAASIALAQLGPIALPEVLLALTNPKLNTVRFREGVIHILHYSSNLAQESIYKHQNMEPKVYIKPGTLVSVRELLTALKGPSAAISSMKAANDLLLQLNKS